LDFRQRGPGTLFSLQQHGLPPFRIADLLGDADCLDEAREDAQLLVTSGALLADPGFAALRRMVQRRYGRVMELADVG
jgi:ATP-dependent DNA helicase RecG